MVDFEYPKPVPLLAKTLLVLVERDLISQLLI